MGWALLCKMSPATTIRLNFILVVNKSYVLLSNLILRISIRKILVDVHEQEI